jgi:hypothetical protein
VEGITCPSGAYASAAAWRKRFGTKSDWNIPKPKLAPLSRASSSTTSIWRSSRMSAALRKIRCRSAGGVCDHAGKAATAASTARCASAGPPAGAVATTSPVNGSVSS